MIKKNATLSGTIITLLLAIGIFIGCYLWLNQAVIESGNTLDNKYSNVYDEYNTQTDNIQGKLNDIKDNFDDVKEADSVYQQAINGFKGLGNILLLPLSFIDYLLSGLYSTNTLIDLPGWAKTLINIAALTFLVFLLIAVLKGESKT